MRGVCAVRRPSRGRSGASGSRRSACRPARRRTSRSRRPRRRRRAPASCSSSSVHDCGSPAQPASTQHHAPRAPRAARARHLHSAAASLCAGDFFVAWPSTISCPHAARMSRPRLLRTETVKPLVGEDLRERVDALVGRPLERNARRGVERQQVDLGLDAGEQLDQPARVLRRVVDAASITYSNVMRRRLAEREALAGVDHVLQRVLLGRAARWRRAAPRWSRAARPPGSASAASRGQPVHHRHQADRRQRDALADARQALPSRSASAAPSSSRRSCAAARPCPSARC